MTPRYSVWLRRRSPRPTELITFLTALGLRRVDRGGDPAAAIFAGNSGLLDIRGAVGSDVADPTARTALWLAAASSEVRDHELRSPAGLPVGVEVDPRTAAELREPGAGFGDQRVAASMDVVAVCTVPRPDAEEAFFAELGFTALGPGEGYRPMVAGPGSGVVGLRRGSGVAVGMGLETSEPFDALIERLRVAGHPAALVDDDSGVRIRLTDPDGERLEIRGTR